MSVLRNWVELGYCYSPHKLTVRHKPQYVWEDEYKCRWTCRCGAKGRSTTLKSYEARNRWWKHFQDQMRKVEARLRFDL